MRRPNIDYKSPVTTLVTIILVIAFSLMQQAVDSRALETVVSEANCRIEGFSRPLRQTIVVVDEAAIDPFTLGPVSETNRRLNREILSLAGVSEGQTVNLSEPRERITVLLATEDGRELIRAFTGCPPTYSQDEIEGMEKANSGISNLFLRFIGDDVKTQITNQKLAFESSLLQTMTQLAKYRSSKPKTNGQMPDGIGFLRTLSMLGNNLQLPDGIPRIVVVSPMKVPALVAMGDKKSARELGFNLASTLGGDFQRAEVYLIGVSDDASTYTRDFAQTLFLGLKGRLIAATGVSLPAFAEAPASVRVFQGFIDYGGPRVPMQVRLAFDQGGSLVNSWVEVAVERPVATPFTGKAICKTDSTSDCEVQGDGKEFSQSWVADVRDRPTFDAKLPFSGARFFQMSTSASGAKGKVYDPNLMINKQKELPFDLSETSKIRF